MGKSFKDQPFSARFNQMGDEAEGVFETVEPLGKSERFGWNRPAVSMQRMSPELRYMPDYYTSMGMLVEVQGCGRDHTIKLKEEKLEALATWNEVQPVAFFFWNNKRMEWALLTFDDIIVLCADAVMKAFPEGKRYYPIHWDAIKEVVPHEVQPEE